MRFFDHNGHLGGATLGQTHTDQPPVGRLLYGGGEKRLETGELESGAGCISPSRASLPFPRRSPLTTVLTLGAAVGRILARTYCGRLAGGEPLRRWRFAPREGVKQIISPLI